MVKLYELFEASNKKDVSGNIQQILETECSDILKTYRKTGHILIRGLSAPSSTSSFIKGQSRNNRTPVFMDNDFHKIVIDAYDLLGIEANRGNSLFTFGTNGFDATVFNAAKAWGTVYIMFPVNGFSFSWFSNYGNYGSSIYPFNFIHEFLYTKHEEIEFSKDQGSLLDYGNRREVTKQLANLLDKNGLTDKNLDQALTSMTEILIKGSYYALKFTSQQSYRKILQIP